MNPEVRLLFRELAEVSPRERERVFRERRIGAELRAELESLLSFDTTEVMGLTVRISNAATEVLRAVDGLELSHCGPYRLVRLLGSGGMGAVYLGERTDGEIQQRVAVKLLRADGHRSQWRERFLRERQMLASLDHPSIVHVIDAGHTSDARPFLVMEHVEGVAIDVFAAGIEVRDRLKLFLRVCEGVSHAHRHLIVHRDLKPSNILVNTSGQPKLLDFGIAKLLDEAGDGTQTQTVERMLTPRYASPEQLAGTAQTTATDIYSLGAVLYKLLTGVALRENAANKANGEIVLPSRVNPDVPKDLDYIVGKALRAEPEERYNSVDQFASDIRAALAWRPVGARSGNVWYRARRFLRRHWVSAGAAALVVASLSGGVYVANRERAMAERRFLDVRQLANKLFDIDVQVAQLQGGSKTRQLIVDTALEYLRRVTADVRMDPELALEMGTAYMRVGRVQGVNISPNLGQTKASQLSEERAQALIDSVLASQPGNRTALLRAAQIAHDRMILADNGQRDDDVMKFTRTAVERLEQYLRTGSLNRTTDRPEAQQVIITFINVANKYVKAERFEEAIRLCNRAIEIAHATDWPAQAGAALMIVALSHRAEGDLDEALQAVRESVRILEPPVGEKSTGRVGSFALALKREGEILGKDDAISLNRTGEAVEYLLRSLKISEDSARRDADDFQSQYAVYDTEVKLADILRHTDTLRALAMYDDGLQRLERIKSNASTTRHQASTLAGSVYPLRRLGRDAEARKRLDAALEILSRLKLYPAEQIELGAEADHVLRARADYEGATGNARRGAELYDDLLKLVRAGNPKPETSLADALDLSNIYRAAAPLYRRAGQTGLARTLETSRFELWQRWNSKFPDKPFIRRQLDAARIP